MKPPSLYIRKHTRLIVNTEVLPINRDRLSFVLN